MSMMYFVWKVIVVKLYLNDFDNYIEMRFLLFKKF